MLITCVVVSEMWRDDIDVLTGTIGSNVCFFCSFSGSPSIFIKYTTFAVSSLSISVGLSSTRGNQPGVALGDNFIKSLHDDDEEIMAGRVTLGLLLFGSGMSAGRGDDF